MKLRHPEHDRTGRVLMIALCLMLGTIRHLNGLVIETPEETVILTNLNLISGTSSQLERHRTLIIRGHLIHEIRNKPPGITAPHTRTIDLQGQYVIPGLIDSHTHMMPFNSEKPLEYALLNGITVIRDMAGDASYLKEVQNAIARGEIIGPDICYSALVAGDRFIQTSKKARMATPDRYKPGQAPWMRAVTPQSDIASIIGDAKASGAMAIKIYQDLSAPLVRRLTREAHRQGLRVWSHAAVFPATAEDVIHADVDTISHTALLLFPDDWDLARDGALALRAEQAQPRRLRNLFGYMRHHHMALDPTLLVYSRMIKTPKESDPVMAATKMAHDMGVTLVAGTDTFMKNEAQAMHDLHAELELLVRYAGLSESEALRAATINGARVLGIDRTHGTIEPGKYANLVVLRQNPLTDIAHTRTIAWVMKEGRIYPRPKHPESDSAR